MEQTINWTGDARKTISPPADAPGILPRAVRLGTAKQVRDQFIASGKSVHTPIGTTLWVVLDFCLSAGIAHELTTAYCESGSVMGYTVRRVGNFYS